MTPFSSGVLFLSHHLPFSINKLFIMSNPVSESSSCSKKRVYLETLGCSKNRVDSEIMLASLQNQGYELTMTPDSAEVIIVNTCAFLTEASEESINRILDLSDFKSSGNCEKIVATGCLTQRYQDSLAEQIPELDGLLGSNGFEQIPELVRSMYEGSGHLQAFLKQKPHYKQFEEQSRTQTTPYHYTYLKVAEGCSNMCSFCNIPALRGNFSSRTVNSIITEISNLIEKGVKEINLISQDISSYGKDFNDNTELATLLKNISEIEGDFWIRLFYCYPNSFTDETMEVIADDNRFCRYLDMPFQHINNEVLKAMNRKIDRRQIENKMQEIRTHLPNLAWRTTFIVGFPTETEERFQELLEFVSAGHFQHVGVFLYSHEDNIRSAKWGDPVPNALKHERRNQLMEAQQKVSIQKNESWIGEKMKVLVDGVSAESDLLLQGRSEYQGPEVDGLVYINEGTARPGTFHTVEISKAYEYDLIGRIV